MPSLDEMLAGLEREVRLYKDVAAQIILDSWWNDKRLTDQQVYAANRILRDAARREREKERVRELAATKKANAKAAVARQAQLEADAAKAVADYERADEVRKRLAAKLAKLRKR